MVEHTEHNRIEEKDEEARASVDIWRYALGSADTLVLKCIIELKVPEAIENNTSRPVTLAELSTAVSCSQPYLYRIMRYLSHQGVFKEVPTETGETGYLNTPLSRRLMITKRDDKSMAALILLISSPLMLSMWTKLRSIVSDTSGEGLLPMEAAHGKDLWGLCAEDPAYGELFNEAMSCIARCTVSIVARTCVDVFEGVETVVDVGGGNGDALGTLVNSFPWIKGFNFDLPHVVGTAREFNRVQHVAGDMFNFIPKADVVFLKSVLHDWDDEKCIEILKNCREAIPTQNGKVVIVEAVIGKKADGLEFARLIFDIGMMIYTNNGKERNLKEWDYLLTEAGFPRYEVRDVEDFSSVIVAYPS